MQRSDILEGDHSVVGQKIEETPQLPTYKSIRRNRQRCLNWQNRNKAALRSYWALDKSGALAIKAEIEKLLEQEGENETSEEGPAQGSESRGRRRK
jgi:hypothetical protein